MLFTCRCCIPVDVNYLYMWPTCRCCLPVDVVLEAVVARVGDEAAAADAEREEDLTRGVRPHLERGWVCRERGIALLVL